MREHGDRKKTGDRAEDIALDYLANKGYEILERNYRTRTSEIDIIAKDGDEIVFVEVRSIKRGGFHPFFSITTKKLNHLKRGILHYLASRGLIGRADVRIDIIGVVFEDGGVEVEHIENAVMF